MKEKSFITLTPEVNVRKRFFFVNDGEAKYAGAFVHCKAFQPGLIFANKAGVFDMSRSGLGCGLTRKYQILD
jgi:hypothetical protein